MRLFYGLSLPGHIRRASAERAQEAMRTIEGRYLPASNHHITLAFLGDVPFERISHAKDILSRVIERFPAPALTLGDTSYFGRAQNAILIIRILDNAALSPMHDALIAALKDAELPCDPGPFSPHITLARHARIENAPLPKGEALSFVPAQAHLFLSARNEAQQLIYTPVFSVSYRVDTP